MGRSVADQRVFIGLGSNLDNPEKQICRAIEYLKHLPDSSWVCSSSLYSSPPMGPQDQPDYVNAVACILTSLQPKELLLALKNIEVEQGREENKIRWGARKIDLDILLYGDNTIHEPGLNIPHSGCSERAFVLYPLYEIANEITIPGQGLISDLLDQCPVGDMKRLEK